MDEYGRFEHIYSENERHKKTKAEYSRLKKIFKDLPGEKMRLCDKLEQLWGHGYANSRRLQFDKNGVAALVGYITKSHHSKDEERITYKAWNGSRNLIDPEPEISDTKVKSRKKAMELADGDFNAWNEIFPEYEIADINQFHSDEYGSIYLFARLYRRDGKRMPPKRKVKK